VTEQECWHKLRAALSDRTGVLRFESFDIVNAPDCAETAATLRHYLVGRPLAETDPAHIRKLGRATEPVCAQLVARLVQRSQRRFLGISGCTSSHSGRPEHSADPRATGRES